MLGHTLPVLLANLSPSNMLLCIAVVGCPRRRCCLSVPVSTEVWLGLQVILLVERSVRLRDQLAQLNERHAGAALGASSDRAAQADRVRRPHSLMFWEWSSRRSPGTPGLQNPRPCSVCLQLHEAQAH